MKNRKIGKWTLTGVSLAMALLWHGSVAAQNGDPIGFDLDLGQTIWDDIYSQGKIFSSWGTQAVVGGLELERRVYDPYDRTRFPNPVQVIVLDKGGVGNHISLRDSMNVAYEGRGHWFSIPNPLLSHEVAYTVGCYPHPTHIAGIVGGKSNGFQGIFPGVPIYSVALGPKGADDEQSKNCLAENPLDVESSVEKALQAIYNYIVDNQRGQKKVSVVISMSLNISGSDQSIRRLIKKLATAEGEYPGAVIVQSAGNSFVDACYYSYWTGDDFNRGSAHPADGVLVVGALKRNGLPVLYDEFDQAEYPIDMSPDSKGASNYGRCVDVWAPGFDIHSTWGDRINSVGLSDGNIESDVHRMLSGTSMSAPHIAALAAYVIATSPEDMTPADVEKKIRERAVDLAFLLDPSVHGSQIGGTCGSGRCPILMPMMPALEERKCSIHSDAMGTGRQIEIRGDGGYYSAEVRCEAGVDLSVDDILWIAADDYTGELARFAGLQKLENVYFAPNTFGSNLRWRLGLLIPRLGVVDSVTLVQPQASGSTVSCEISPNLIDVPAGGGWVTATAICPVGTDEELYRWTWNGYPLPMFNGQRAVTHLFPSNTFGNQSWTLGFKLHPAAVKTFVATIRQPRGLGWVSEFGHHR